MSSGVGRGQERSPLWKVALQWAVGSFVGISIMRGFPPGRESLEFWAVFVVGGLLADGTVRFLNPWLRRFKVYRNLEAKLGLNRDGRA